ncbi:MAG: CPBP family intramembrane metalloprotease [Candidatus Yanofskybacteria bacterium]|nr:CPBP family intramembrane metalloprotease [Candidatus Yanofskybacteria bacterium]
MWEYLEWLNGFEYLYLPSQTAILFYLLLAICFYGLRVIVVLKFIYLRWVAEESAKREIHGSKREWSLLTKILFYAMAILVAPLVEEIAFRGPILWFVLGSQYIYAFSACIILSFIFMVCHMIEPRGKYKDGTRIRYAGSALYSTGIGGVFYGLIVVISGSIWPSIFLHMLWNSNILFIILGEERINRYALALQR